MIRVIKILFEAAKSDMGTSYFRTCLFSKWQYSAYSQEGRKQMG